MPQFIMGSRGMPRRYYDYLEMYEPFHKASTIGSWLLGVGFLILLVMFTRSLLSGKPAPRNPWGSAALEWMTPSPPPTYNFVEGKEPILTRGQYDFHLATEDELYEGYDDPMFPGLRNAAPKATAKPAAKSEPPPAKKADKADKDEKADKDDKGDEE
jgi:cytochrome c oxidase subunit I